MQTSRAFCTICAIELAQGQSSQGGAGNLLSGQKGMLPLDVAYKNAKERAKNQDADLDIRMQQIRRQMDQISQ